ncbi:MAG: cobalt ECF transporter T component CbiQ [Nitrospirales bacterium]|nr:cobalt ECF transporter T component CbiQ [Nitrospirales bacterium]
MASKIPSFLLNGEHNNDLTPPSGRGRLSLPFIERGIKGLAGTITTSYLQWELSSKDGLLQRLDPRVKVIFWLSFIVVISLKREIMPEVWICIALLCTAVLCKTAVTAMYKRALLLSLFFGFLVALPSGLNLITRGDIIIPLIRLPREYSFWIYQIPAEIGFTREGMAGVAMLTLRVFNSATLSLMILYTTPFTSIATALRVLRVPDLFIMVITLAYKYIFLFARTVEEMHLAKKSRLAGEISSGEARIWMTGMMGLLFRRTQQRFEEVYKAMMARGFAGTYHISAKKGLTGLDWSFCCLFSVMTILFLWL